MLAEICCYLKMYFSLECLVFINTFLREWNLEFGSNHHKLISHYFCGDMKANFQIPLSTEGCL